MKVLIGIPALNEELHIRELCEKASKYGDVIVINNGSTDNTEEEARKGGAHVFTYNWRGYGRALRAIFRKAELGPYDAVITLDGDGQHDPDEIPLFLEALGKTDVVIGNRFLKGGGAPLHREAVIKAFNSAYKVGDSQCGFRAYTRYAVKNIRITEDEMGASLQILSEIINAKLSIGEVPVTVTYADKKPRLAVLNQGANLIEVLFWTTVWRRPYTYLGLPSLALMALSIGFGLGALDVYLKQSYLIPSYALVCGLSFLGSILLIIFIFNITVSRRIVSELKPDD